MSNAYNFASQANEMMDRGRFDYGLDLAQKAVGADPTYPRAHVCLGRAYVGLKDYKVAISHLENALELDAENIDALYFLAYTYRQLNKPKVALQYIQDCARILPEDSSVLAETGFCLLALNRNKEAEAAFYQARELDPDDADNHNAIGYFYLQTGKFEQAETCFRAGLKIQANNANLLNNLGVALENQKKLKDAAIAYKSAILSEPTMELAKSNAEQSISKFKGQGAIGAVLTFALLASVGYFVTNFKKMLKGQVNWIAIVVPLFILMIIYAYSQIQTKKNIAELDEVDPELLEIYKKIQKERELNRKLKL